MKKHLTLVVVNSQFQLPQMKAISETSSQPQGIARVATRMSCKPKNSAFRNLTTSRGQAARKKSES